MKLLVTIPLLFLYNIFFSQTSLGMFLIEANDCPNCFVGVINLKKKLEKEKTPFIYVLKGLSENEVDDFFRYTLQDSNRTKNKSVIVNHRLFNFYARGYSGSRFVGLRDQAISFNYSTKDINDSLTEVIQKLLKDSDTSIRSYNAFDRFSKKDNELCKSNNIFNNRIVNNDLVFSNNKSNVFYRFNLETKKIDSLFNVNTILNNQRINELLARISCQSKDQYKFACEFEYLNSRVFGYSNLWCVNRERSYLGVDIYYATKQNNGHILVNRHPYLIRLNKFFQIDTSYSPSVCVAAPEGGYYAGLSDHFLIHGKKLYTIEYHNSASQVNFIETNVGDKFFDSLSSKVFSFPRENFLPRFVNGTNRGYAYKLIESENNLYYFNHEIPVFVNLKTAKRNEIKGILFNRFASKDSLSNFYIISVNTLENSLIEIVYLYNQKILYSQLSKKFELEKTKILFEEKLDKYKFVAFDNSNLHFVNTEDDLLFSIPKQ
jgi:hypothetical protein